jgi:hypothetical protein
MVTFEEAHAVQSLWIQGDGIAMNSTLFYKVADFHRGRRPTAPLPLKLAP